MDSGKAKKQRKTLHNQRDWAWWKWLRSSLFYWSSNDQTLATHPVLPSFTVKTTSHRFVNPINLPFTMSFIALLISLSNYDTAWLTFRGSFLNKKMW